VDKQVIASWGLLTLTLAAAIWYIHNNFDQFKSISVANPFTLILLAFLLIVAYLIIGLTTDVIHRQMGLPLTYFESVALSIMTGFYNLITPFKGGMAARALYLKKKYDFSYTDFLATLAASYIIIFLVSSFLGLIATYLIYFYGGIFSWIVFTIFAAIFLPLLFIVVFSPRFKEPEHRWIGKIVRVINGWHLIRHNHKTISLLALFSTLQLLVSTVMLYLQFHVFGIQVTFIQSLFLTAITSLSLIIAITPAGLGITEAVTVFSALTIGITPAQSLSAALLGRIVSVVVLFILGPICSYLLLKKGLKKPSS
jgi:uncharacterized protein (TIRG00374 family)